MQIIRIAIFFFGGLLFGGVSHAQHPADTLRIKGANNEWLDHYYRFYEDANRSHSIQAAYHALQQGLFKKRKKGGSHAFNGGITRSIWWLHLYIKNDTTEKIPLVWSFYNNDIEFVLYELDNTGKAILIDSASTNEHATQRPFFARSVSIPFSLQPQETKSLLVKAYTKNAENIYFPTDITTPQDLYAWELDFAFEIGRYIGYFTLASIINLLLFIALRYKLHFYLGIYILFITAFQLNEFMYDGLWFTPDIYAIWTKIPKAFFLAGMCYWSFRICIKFLEIDSKIPSFKKLLRIYRIVLESVLILFIAAVLVIGYQSNFTHVLHLISDASCIVTMLFIFILACISIRINKRDAILYLICNVPLILSIVELLVNTFFQWHPFQINPGNIMVSSTFEVTLFSIVLVYKYSFDKKKSTDRILQLEKDKLELYTDILEVQERERKRIARDLHDDIGGIASSLKLLMSNFFIKQRTEQNDQAYKQSLLNQAGLLTERIREISHDLLPKDFERRGLVNILAQKLDLLNENEVIRFHLVVEGNDGIIPTLTQVIVYRIISELLTNIIKHSKASKAIIQLNMQAQEIEIMIEDDGIGMQQHTKEGIGLSNIKSRVQFLNGKLNIDANNSGTIFIINIPLT